VLLGTDLELGVELPQPDAVGLKPVVRDLDPLLESIDSRREPLHGEVLVGPRCCAGGRDFLLDRLGDAVLGCFGELGLGLFLGRLRCLTIFRLHVGSILDDSGTHGRVFCEVYLLKSGRNSVFFKPFFYWKITEVNGTLPPVSKTSLFGGKNLVNFKMTATGVLKCLGPPHYQSTSERSSLSPSRP
jgi:hypothetical protein